MPRGFGHGPALSKGWEHARSGKYSEEELYAWAADCYTSACETNEPLQKPKTVAVRWGMMVLLFESIALGLAVGNVL